MTLRLRYTPAVDGLRALAITAVLAFHAHLPFFQGGFLGVDLFFVISGFLITALLLGEWADAGEIRLGAFYARRALRLLPALFFLLAVYSTFEVLNGRPLPVGIVGPVVFYVANWWTAFAWGDLGAFGHTWSLAVEEQFYMLWPLVLLFLLRRGIALKSISRGLAWSIGAVVVWRWILSATGSTNTRLYAGLDSRADTLLVGCWLGVQGHLGAFTDWSRWSRRLAELAVLSTVGMALLVAFSQSKWSFFALGGDTLVAVACGIIVAYTFVKPNERLMLVLRQPPLVWIGRLSYSLYLWHYPLFKLAKALGYGPGATAGLALLTTFACAVFSYYLVERPFLRLKDRWATKVEPNPKQPAPA